MKWRVHPTYKTKHHVQNWAFYDRALVRRGDVTIWLSPAAIETGGEAASLGAKVKELEGRRVAIDGELRSSKPVPRLRPEVVEGRLTEWRRFAAAIADPRPRGAAAGTARSDHLYA